MNKKNNHRFENKTFFLFFRNFDVIFRFDNNNIERVFVFRKFCILQFMIDEIFNIVYDDVNNHSNFHKCYKQFIFLYYIRNLFKQLRNYLRHCFQCQIHQIKRHKFHKSL